MELTLKDYIKKISNESVNLEVSIIGEPEDDLIYRAVLIVNKEGKTSVSNRFTKCLINKLRRDSELIKEKTDKNVYIFSQKYSSGVISLSYVRGELKDRYK